jgi:hypothetical protein
VKRVFGTPIVDYLPTLGLLVLTVIYLITGYGYAPEARTFPVTVAWVAIALVVLDLLSRTKTPAGKAVTRWLNPSTSAGKLEAQTQYALSKQIAAAAWPLGFVALIVLTGFLVAVPIFVMASMYFRGRRSLLICIPVSAAATLFIWFLFAQVLQLELYPGVLFGNS